MLTTLPPGGQITVQVPQNDSHPSHRLAHDVARESPFREALGGYVRETYALGLERYAEILYAQGYREQICIEKIYGHEMASSRDVTEWVKGSVLTAYLSKLDTEGQAAYIAAYNDRLLAVLGEQQPYFYPFRRLLFWARRPE
jgi:trans-aconitate 2-methyltransferase